MTTLAGKPISAYGVGLMRITLNNKLIPDETASKVLRANLANGAALWNGADFYGTPSSNSLHLMNHYFTAYTEDASKVVLCIKKRRESIIFGCVRVDPNVPIEETIKVFGELGEGNIGGIQLSEVSAASIRRAVAVYKIDMVEAELSLWETDTFSNGVAEVCHELGIPIVTYSTLGAGMWAGELQKPEDMRAGDYHKFFARFQADNLDSNFEPIQEVEKLAKAKGCTTPQLALSWIKSQAGRPGKPLVVSVAGARSEERSCRIPKKSCRGSLLRGGRYPPADAKLIKYWIFNYRSTARFAKENLWPVGTLNY
ncbi:NADP-dependent oxidoreductase domain-containing protein [Calycina marina]|uniref:NADP-dependent oxidoreductase domain-containing protein n=1 Tax=Calycina marina TaxID=1763456 RepID=A0A9P7YZS7_9HELO|nr:NADP-dependent oxidoreductase domain-containing protein [Calycina marina]